MAKIHCVGVLAITISCSEEAHPHHGGVAFAWRQVAWLIPHFFFFFLFVFCFFFFFILFFIFIVVILYIYIYF